MESTSLPRHLEGCIKGPFDYKTYTPPEWDVLFMRLVYEVASKSKDQKTKIGAYIAGPDHEPISFGFNGIPRKVFESLPTYQSRFERPTKYLFTEHAERNALYSVCRMGGTSLKGTTMYTQSLPCADCGRAIIQAGIKTVVLHEAYEQIFNYLYSTWKESCQITKDMFLEAGIEVRYVKELIGSTGYVDGKVIVV